MKRDISVAMLEAGLPSRLLAKRIIALLGFGLVASGLMCTDILKAIPITASMHNALILTLLLVAAGLTSVLARCRFVDSIPVVILLLMLRYIGATPMLAVLLVLAAAIVIGRFFNRSLGKLGHASSAVCGIAVLTGLAGWLLPFGIHTFLAYLLVLGSIAIAGRKTLLHTLRCFAHQWRQATKSAPISAGFAMIAVALCAITLLSPTVQYDDLALHILLPEQLAAIGHYKMDVASQVWATAPWASDVLQGYVAVLSGSDARGATNGLWLVLTLAMLWNLGAEVGLRTNLRWYAISLYTTLPIVNALYGSMQADTAITTAALTLTTLTARIIRTRQIHALAAFMVVSGLLMALKPTQALLILPMALIALWHIGPSGFLKATVVRLPITLGICGSSYAYAEYFTGNPILPLFNGVFHSPYAPAKNFDDPRWHQGLSWDSLWQLTFHTDKYQEVYAGAFGFTLLALIGCALLALLQPRTRWLTIGLLFNLVSAFAAIQYARYVIPPVVALIPLSLLAWQGLELRRVGELLLAAVATLNAVFIPTSSWIFSSDINWTLFRNLNRSSTEVSTLLERDYAVESVISRHLALAWPQGYSLYLANPERPFIAPFHGQAFTRSWYDPEMQMAAQKADEDLSGDAWLHLFERTGMTHVLTTGKVSEALTVLLRRVNATPELTLRGATLWRLCKSNCADLNHPLLDQRDLSKRVMR